jgi:hypothetical protein
VSNGFFPCSVTRHLHSGFSHWRSLKGTSSRDCVNLVTTNQPYSCNGLGPKSVWMPNSGLCWPRCPGAFGTVYLQNPLAFPLPTMKKQR